MGVSLLGLGAVAVGAAATGASVSAAIGAAIVTGVIVRAGTAIFGLGPEKPNFDLNSQGLLVNSVGNIEDVPIIYGVRRIAGVRVFAEVSGDDNQYLYQIFALCEGEVNSLGLVLGNQEDLESGDFAAYTTINKHTGTDTQAADATFVADLTSWTADHKLSGVAYLAIRLEWEPDPELNPWTGFPNITCDVTGRKIYDMRPTAPAQGVDDPATWTWSDNPALCILDYLRNSRFGKGIANSAIDFDSFEGAADYCDDLVSVPDDLGNEPTTYTTQKRYTLNGVVLISDTIINNLDRMLTSCRGMLVWSAGQYKLIIDKTQSTTTPAQRTGEAFFHEGNILGGWQISLGDRASRFNRIRAAYFNPDRSWEPDTAIIESATFLAEDNNEVLETEVQLPFTSNRYTAAQLGGILLKQSRERITATFTATLDALEADIGDVVEITHATPGWTDKLFRVAGLELIGSDEVKVSVIEYEASIYSLDTLTEINPTPNTNLPNPATVLPPTNLVLTTGDTVALTLADGTIQARILVQWTASTDLLVDHYEIRWKQAAETEWSSAKVGAALVEYMIQMVEAGVTYDVNVRSINIIGKASTWLTGSTAADGKSLAPGDPSGLTTTNLIAAIRLDWINPSDADLNLIEIRASTTSSWSASVLVGQIRGDHFIHSLPPLTTRYYWIRARDTSGNASAYHPLTTAPGVAGTALQVTTADLIDRVINNSKLDDLAVEAENLANGSVNLGTGVVIGQVTVDKIADDAVTAAKIAAGAVDAAAIAAGAVGTSELAALAVNADKIAANSINDSKIAVGGLTANAIAAGTITANEIAALTITGAKIAAGTISAANITSGTITTAEIAAGTITSGNIAASTITAGNIAASTITGVEIASNAITSTKIAADNITSAHMAANSITAGNGAIANLAVTAAKIAAAAITEAKIGTAAVTTLKVGANAITVPTYGKGGQAHGTSMAAYPSMTTAATTSSWNKTDSTNDVQITASIPISTSSTGLMGFYVQIERWNGSSWVAVWNPGSWIKNSPVANAHWTMTTTWVDSPGAVNGLQYRVRIGYVYSVTKFETAFISAMEVKR